MAKARVSFKAKARTLKEIFKIYGTGVLAAAIIMIVAYQFVAPAPPRSLSIATASKTGAYYSFAMQYQRLFAAENIVLNIIETSGSAENLQLLANGEVEVAFVQGGVGDEARSPDLMGLASLYMEPLLIFARKDDSFRTLLDLKGRTLAIGREGSGTKSIMDNLLAENGLNKDASLATSELTGREAKDALIAGDVDIVFMVTRPDTPMVMEMLEDQRISLVSLARAEAYSRRHHYLSHLVLPRGVFDLSRDLPSQDIHCLAPAATLVVNDRMHPALTDLLLQIVSKVHGRGPVLDQNTSFPSTKFLDFPLNREAERFFQYGPPFLQRYLPFWAASLVDRLKFMLLPLIALILPLVKILPPTYRWRTRSKIYRWYDELHDLDQKASGEVSVSGLKESLQALDNMEHEVRRLEVPLSYAEELYHLRMHIDFLRNQLHKRLLIEHKKEG